MGWASFYFDSNNAFGVVDSPETWARMKRLLVAAWLDDMRTVEKGMAGVRQYIDQAPRRLPLFTLYKDGDGKTLKEFFDTNGMKWEA